MKIVYRLKDITDDEYLYLNLNYLKHNNGFSLDKYNGICIYETNSLLTARKVRLNYVDYIDYAPRHLPEHTFNPDVIEIVAFKIIEEEITDMESEIEGWLNKNKK